MHRTKNVPRTRFWGVLLGLVLSGVFAAGARAQDVKPIPRIMSVGDTLRLEIVEIVDGKEKPTGKVIKRVAVENDRVVLVIADPTGEAKAVLASALARGVSRVSLFDTDNKLASIYDIKVDFDVQLLRATLKKAVPTANVLPVLVGDRTLILTGTVE